MVRLFRHSNTNNELPRNPPPVESEDADLNTTLASFLNATSSVVVPPETTVPITMQNLLQLTVAPQTNHSAFAPPLQ